MTRKIELTQGKFALVDNEDYERVNRYKWFATRHRLSTGIIKWYAGNGKLGRMQNFIMGIKSSRQIMVDHINRNGLDNRKKNLRMATNRQNALNRLSPEHSSKYRGVSFDKFNNCWKVSLVHNNTNLHLGRFDNEEEAAKVYDEKSRELNGEWAHLNFPRSKTYPTRKKLNRNNTSGYRGVSGFRGKWVANIQINETNIYLGEYITKKEAAKAYDIKARELWGEKAVLNFPKNTLTK